MDAYLTGAIIDALTKGDLSKVIGYVLIFTFLWIEVRGAKKELHKINEHLATGFAAGETRFKNIENDTSLLKHRVSVLETKS